MLLLLHQLLPDHHELLGYMTSGELYDKARGPLRGPRSERHLGARADEALALPRAGPASELVRVGIVQRCMFAFCSARAAHAVRAGPCRCGLAHVPRARMCFGPCSQVFSFPL